MSAHYPQSLASLRSISGVGEVKARQFGDAFVTVIREYCAKKGIAEQPKESPREKSDQNRRYVAVGDAFNSGEGVEALAKRYSVSVGTILDNLGRFVAAGNHLKNGKSLQRLSSLPATAQEAALLAFAEQGTDFLKPVFEKLDGRISYDELKILRLLFLTGEPNAAPNQTKP